MAGVVVTETAIVDLRGPCGRLAGRLDVARGVIQRLCRECTRCAGHPVYHWFDAETGEAVAGEPFGEDEGSAEAEESLA